MAERRRRPILIHRLPGTIVETGRRLRSLILRAAEPIDRLLRPGDARDLPPLWLRRHAGPVRNFSSSAEQTAALIDRLALLRPIDTVLDIGCGPGAMAIEFQKLLDPEGTYVGFDVHHPSIRWCRKRFASDPRFRFELADIQTPFSLGLRGAVEEFQFPAVDGRTDFVLAKSVFTHLLEPESQHYLREISRVLRPGRAALVTAFLFDRRLSDIPAFPFQNATGSVRWKIRARPHAAVAFSRELFESLIRSADLRIDRMIDGFYPGSAPEPTGQDVLVVRKA